MISPENKIEWVDDQVDKCMIPYLGLVERFVLFFLKLLLIRHRRRLGPVS